jgi:hypothetical protein
VRPRLAERSRAASADVVAAAPARAGTRRDRPSAMSRSHTTTDHDEIRRWAEERGGTPSAVKGTSRRKQDVGMIRIDFPGYSGAGKLEPISWDEWFQKFDESKLALVLQDETSDGEKSNFNKLVGRETAAARSRGVRTSRHHPARAKARKQAKPAKKTSTGRKPAAKKAGARATRRRSASR